MSKKWTANELERKVVAIKPMSADDENRIYKKLISARVSILIGYPFFGYLTAHLEFVCDYTIITAATDGNKFYYNPYYIDSLDTPYCAFIIVHELMHCALQHMTRCASREPQRWNYACDYAIHSIIMSYLNHWESKSSQRNAIKMPKNCLYNSKYDNMSSEQIYSILPDNYMSCPQFGVREKILILEIMVIILEIQIQIQMTMVMVLAVILEILIQMTAIMVLAVIIEIKRLLMTILNGILEKRKKMLQ